MRKVIVIAIRYSVLFGSNTKGFHLSAKQDSYDSYKNKLFCQERMKLREWLFENITLRSLHDVFLNKPKDVEFKVLVMTSTELPIENKLFLERLEGENESWLSISYIHPSKIQYGKHIRSLLEEDTEKLPIMLSTVRLDDDDALFKEYACVVGGLMSEEADSSIVSFSLGYNVYISNEKEILGASERYFLNNSAGLAYIKKHEDYESIEVDNIYACGNHMKVGQKFKVINFDKSHGFLRVNTENSDRMYKLSEEQRKKRVALEFERQANKVSLEDVERSFFSFKN